MFFSNIQLWHIKVHALPSDCILEEHMTFHLQNLIMIISITRKAVTEDSPFAVSSQIWCEGKPSSAWDTRGENINLQVHHCKIHQLHKFHYHLFSSV